MEEMYEDIIDTLASDSQTQQIAVKSLLASQGICRSERAIAMIEGYIAGDRDHGAFDTAIYELKAMARIFRMLGGSE